MKSKYFLDLANSVEKFSYRIKNLFKKDVDRARDFFELSTCLQIGNLDKFEEFFNKKYEPSSFTLLIPHAVSNGKLETFLKLEEKAIQRKRIHKHFRSLYPSSAGEKIKYALNGDFYGIAIKTTMTYNNKAVLKHLINNKIINIFEISHEHILEASSHNSIEVLQYIFYDLKYPTSHSLMHSLTFGEEGKKHTNTVELIEKRDLFFQLDTELNKEKAGTKPKPNKI